MTKDELNDRAKECAKCIQNMALQPLVFANIDYLTKWFETILAHEHKTRPTAPSELAELRGKLEGMKKPVAPYKKGHLNYDGPQVHNAAIDLALGEIDKMRRKGK